MKIVYIYSSYAQQLGSLLIAVVGLVLFSKRNRAIRLIGIYGLNSFIFQTILHAFTFLNFKGSHINLTGNIYTISETIILLYFFYNLFSNNHSKRTALSLGLIYVIAFFVSMQDRWFEVNSLIRTMRDLIMIICTLQYFYFMIKDMPTSQITKFPMFWIMTAFLVFFAGTFVLSLSLDFLINVLKDDLAFVWTARNFFRFFFCLIVSYGLWMDLLLVRAKQAFA